MRRPVGAAPCESGALAAIESKLHRPEAGLLQDAGCLPVGAAPSPRLNPKTAIGPRRASYRMLAASLWERRPRRDWIQTPSARGRASYRMLAASLWERRPRRDGIQKLNANAGACGRRCRGPCRL